MNDCLTRIDRYIENIFEDFLKKREKFEEENRKLIKTVGGYNSFLLSKNVKTTIFTI